MPCLSGKRMRFWCCGFPLMQTRINPRIGYTEGKSHVVADSRIPLLLQVSQSYHCPLLTESYYRNRKIHLFLRLGRRGIGTNIKKCQTHNRHTKKEGLFFITPLFIGDFWCRRRDSNPHERSSPPPQDGVSTRFHHFGKSLTTKIKESAKNEKCLNIKE